MTASSCWRSRTWMRQERCSSWRMGAAPSRVRCRTACRAGRTGRRGRSRKDRKGRNRVSRAGVPLPTRLCHQTVVVAFESWVLHAESSRSKGKIDPKQSVGPAEKQTLSVPVSAHERVMGDEPTWAALLRTPNQSIAIAGGTACDWHVNVRRDSCCSTGCKLTSQSAHRPPCGSPRWPSAGGRCGQQPSRAAGRRLSHASRLRAGTNCPA